MMAVAAPFVEKRVRLNPDLAAQADRIRRPGETFNAQVRRALTDLIEREAKDQEVSATR